MQVREIGEFGLIEILAELVDPGRQLATRTEKAGFRLQVGIGDDTAAWQCGEATELATTDTVVEGVHFTRQTTPWFDLGWKLMAANASDIAAMGGVPLYSLVTLGLPADTLVDDVKLLYQGMIELAGRHEIAIVGGDIVRSPVAFVTVALNGAHQGTPLRRSTARPGQQLAVTGYLGSSAGGLELMLEGMEAGPDASAYLKQAHRRPEPCVWQGKMLSELGIAVAMDISDGLLDDLSKLCTTSGVAAQVLQDRVPIHPLLREAFPDQSLEMALNGGEDYQLLFAASPDVMGQAVAGLGPPATVIGEIIAGKAGSVTVVGSSGEVSDVTVRGWDHFR